MSLVYRPYANNKNWVVGKRFNIQKRDKTGQNIILRT